MEARQLGLDPQRREFTFGPERTRVSLCLGAWLVIGMSANAAEPYIPVADSEVLEVLPRSLLSSRDELTTLRRQLARNPNHLDVATRVAQRYLSMGNQSGDPRFFGYARAAIGPWWEGNNPPPEVLKLRAKLKEKDHLYDEALVDLKRLLKQNPRDAQAWMELANIQRVQGDFAEARKACDSLKAFAGRVPSTLCRAPLQAATGQAEDAYASLEQILPLARQQFPSTVQWILTMQAQIAQALGRERQAEQHFREGLSNDPGDTYLIRAYADFLLDRNQAEDAFLLLRNHTSDNGILLRAAIAARSTGRMTLAAEWQQQLERRFDEIRLRGSQPHGRFEARYKLELKDEPRAALSLAAANWEVQKEARDTRNVLEAALAAGDRAAAQPVVDFLARHGTQDVTLQKLVEQLDRN